MATFNLKINGKSHAVEADADTPLLWVLRDHVGLVGTKFGCGIAQCGACTVHANGNAVRSCSVQAWIKHDVPQCGYCQAGQIMSAAALLDSNGSPSDKDIDDAMSGNICRCGTYTRIKSAIKSAAKMS